MTGNADQFSGDATELSWTANAYLDCAWRLCKSLIDDDYERSIHHNRVPLHLAFLALELYFKAGLAAAQRPYPKHHDLAELRTLYSDAMPDVPLPLPSFFEDLITTSLDLFEDKPAPDLAVHFARLRYTTDRRGQAFPQLDMADLRQLQAELEKLSDATQAVKLKIWKEYGFCSPSCSRASSMDAGWAAGSYSLWLESTKTCARRSRAGADF